MVLDIHMVVPHRLSPAPRGRLAGVLALAGSVALLAGCGKKEARGFLDPAAASSSDLVQIVISPKQGIVARQQSIRLSAFGRNAKGDSVPVAVTWSSSGGDVTPEGDFSSEQRGDFWIHAEAAFGPVTDSALIMVDPVTRVVMSSKEVTVRTGESHALSVTAQYASGEPAVVPIAWWASAGAIDSNGVYAAPPTPGVALVVATAASGAADTTTVTVALPVVLIGLRVDPGTDSLEAGQARLVTVEGVWSDGSTGPVPVDFTATGGRINADGLFVAGEMPGVFAITARARNAPVEATAPVVVRLRIVTALKVDPELVQLLPGAFQDFTGSGLTAWGLRVVAVHWSATGGTISPEGHYVAGNTVGDFWVVGAVVGTTIADTVVVRIVPVAATLAKVVITPAAVALPAGQVQQFAVSGLWSDGTTAAPPVAWTATGGTISSGGAYSAGSQPGTYRVIAHHGASGVADSSVVVITAPALSRLEVSPGATTVQVRSTIQFGVAGTWTDGSTVPPSVTWSATGGTITSAGVYSAGSATGTFRVVAQQAGGTFADTSVVTITNAALRGISITPSTTSLVIGGVQQFQGAGIWSSEGTGAPPLAWSATGGIVSSTGRYVAGLTAGSYRIIAWADATGFADTAFVTLTSAGPTVTNFALAPAATSVTIGGTAQFQSAASWSDGATRPVTVTYSATGGTVSVNGLYHAGQVAGTFIVIASCSCGKADTSGVTVTGPNPTAALVAIILSPSLVSVTAGQQQQFSVTGRASDGSSVQALVTWAATGGTINGSGGYAAGSTIGTYRVIATVQGGGLADTATVSIVAAPPPGTFPAPTHGTKDFESGLWSTAPAITNGGGAAPGFNSGLSAGHRLINNAASANGGNWSYQYDYVPSAVEIGANAEAFRTSSTGADADEMYWRYDFKLTGSPVTSQLKWMRFRGANNDLGGLYGTGGAGTTHIAWAFGADGVPDANFNHAIGLSWGPFPSALLAAGYTKYGDNLLNDGKWHRILVHLQRNNGVTNPRVRFWFDGVPIRQNPTSVRSAHGSQTTTTATWTPGSPNDPDYGANAPSWLTVGNRVNTVRIFTVDMNVTVNPGNTGTGHINYDNMVWSTRPIQP